MNATFTLRDVPADNLDSATKYPSIPTYHTIQGNGGLTGPAIPFDGPVVVREKIDGCNSRLIVMPDGTFALGSREDLLYASGDYLSNPAHGIVSTLLPWTKHWMHSDLGIGGIQVFYFEVFGGHNLTRASKDYTGEGSVAFRLFDIAVLDYDDVASRTVEQIAAWRERGGQRFLPDSALVDFSERHDIPLAPQLATLDAADLPVDIDDAHEWLLSHAATTRVTLDAGARGRAEGVILRTPDRSTIAKMRLQSYERTRQLRDTVAKIR